MVFSKMILSVACAATLFLSVANADTALKYAFCSDRATISSQSGDSPIKTFVPYTMCFLRNLNGYDWYRGFVLFPVEGNYENPIVFETETVSPERTVSPPNGYAIAMKYKAIGMLAVVNNRSYGDTIQPLPNTVKIPELHLIFKMAQNGQQQPVKVRFEGYSQLDFSNFVIVDR